MSAEAADRFDSALETLGGGRRPRPAGPFAELLQLAAELGTALSRPQLSSAERQRLHERALTLMELRAAQRGWRGRVRVHRRSAVVGGAALMTALAAVGVAVARERRHHGVGVAA